MATALIPDPSPKRRRKFVVFRSSALEFVTEGSFNWETVGRCRHRFMFVAVPGIEIAGYQNDVSPRLKTGRLNRKVS